MVAKAEPQKQPEKVEEKVVEKEEEQLAVNRTQQVQKGNMPQPKQPVISDNAPKRGRDSIITSNTPQTAVPNVYTYIPNTTYYAVVILNKVDVVFGNEAKNAFNRYHRERYSGIPLELDLQPIDADNKLLLIGEFTNIQGAIDYLQKAKPLASTQIMPWLKGDKYTFSLISEANLILLQEKKNLDEYLKFLDQNLPIKL